MRIFLTGATGFIGSKLCGYLLKNHHQILAPVRNLNSALLLKHHNLELIKIEDSDVNKNYSKFLTNVDVVIHCAARAHIMNESNIKNGILNFYRKVNVDQTLNLAKQAASHKVKRFIFLSSVKVNGEYTLPSESFKYDDISKPADSYAISKFEAEKALKQLSNYTSIETVIIRAPLVYGEEVKGNFLRLLDLCNKELPLPFGSINNIRSMVNVENLIDLILCCLEHPKAGGQVFLISDDQNISTIELIKKIKKFMNKPAKLIPMPLFILKLFGRLMGKSSTIDRLLGSLTIDISHTREVLKWKPIFSLDDGIKKTVSWYLNNL
jgi:nucleoside-diphosphate-sugar epimerase